MIMQNTKGNNSKMKMNIIKTDTWPVYQYIAISNCTSIISTISSYYSDVTTMNKKKETDLCEHISVDMISC